jgi:hydroxyacylglutathione hydrolase
MSQIRIINLMMPFRMGSVNCYLLQNEADFFLIDSGTSNQRSEIEKELNAAGCKPGELKLVILTHGDFDHTGNAAHLRTKYGAKIAMHPDDWGMLEQGDMFWNRKKGNLLIRWLAPKLIGFGKAERCTPDLAIADGYDLGEYGLDAQILSIRGHSSGSIAILTAQGELFCGDLLENTAKPALGSIIDDPVAANASLERLKQLGIKIVYPGHGKPFAMELL